MRSKSIFFPTWVFHRKWVLMANGEWEEDKAAFRMDVTSREWIASRKKVEAHGHKETHPYAYTTGDGCVHKFHATLIVEKWEWRPRWLKWCPLFSDGTQEIEVQFSEGGPGRWKGKVVGLHCEMKPGETPLDTLRRMERHQWQEYQHAV